MYDRILVTTDLSRGADDAIEHAIDAADADDATIYVLSIIDPDEHSSYR